MSASEAATKMAALLSTLSNPNTEAIRAAEAELKPILKHPGSVPALMEILSSSGTEVCMLKVYHGFSTDLAFCEWKGKTKMIC